MALVSDAMSDINIHFDGLILLIALAVGGAVYLLIAVAALTVALAGSHARAWRVSACSALMCVSTSCATAAIFIYWDRHSMAPWADQLVYPWTVAFLGGCWFLARVR
jgi:hypothetical protein